MVSLLVALSLSTHLSVRLDSIAEIPYEAGEAPARVTAVGISNSGYITLNVGFANPTVEDDIPTSVNSWHPVGQHIPEIWSAATGAVIVPYPADTSGDQPMAMAVNNSGEVLGTYDYGNGTRMFLWSITRGFLQLPQVGDNAAASGLNDSGIVVGMGQVDNTGDNPIRIANGVASILQPVHGYAVSSVAMVNASGIMVGSSSGASVPITGVRWPVATVWNAAGIPAALGSLPDTDRSDGTAINDRNEMIGTCTSTVNGKQVGFFYGAQGMQPIPSIGAVSQPASINHFGQVVGAGIFDEDHSVAFLYENGTTIDLNTLLPANSGWVLENASGINDSGQIVGNGVHNGKVRAFLMKIKE